MPNLEARVSFGRGAVFGLDLHLVVPDKGITALIGPSGAGKSTLLRLLAGLERPRAGTIRHGEHSWFDAARDIDLPTRKRRVGFLFQDYALFPHLTVAGNIAYGIPGGIDRAKDVQSWLQRLELTGLADRHPGTLSGGQRQRVALARALASRPEALLLDEPFAAVDIGLRQSIRLLFQEVVERCGIPVIMVTHDLEDALSAADWVAVMIDGRLRRCGPTNEVFSNPEDAEVARILGWSNLLPVDEWQDGVLRGPWGAVEVPASALGSLPGVVAILPDGPRLGRERGLSVEILRILKTNGRASAVCRLMDRSILRVHLAAGSALPLPGARLRLDVPPGASVFLPSDGASLECDFSAGVDANR